MGIQNKIAQYQEYKNGVSHCTFNPEGPGVVRIHLIPPKFRFFRSSSYIVILNGYYLLPNFQYALALLEDIDFPEKLIANLSVERYKSLLSRKPRP